MRVVYILTASQSGVLPRVPMQVRKGKLVLRLIGPYSKLASDQLFSRLKQLARLIGRETVIRA